MGITSLLSTTGRSEGTRLRGECHGDSSIVSTPPYQETPADPAAETVAVAREDVVEETRPRPPRIWPWLLALLLLVVGGLLAFVLLRGGDKTTMPDVVGLTELEARARLADAELEPDIDRGPSDRAAGQVFEQTPGAGTQLEEGEQVEIGVSSGLVRVPVPSVRDLDQQEAIAKIEEAGFRPKLRRVFAGAPAGKIVEQEPRGGERAPRGSTVVLVSSKGRNLERVPDVIGRTEREAVQVLRRRGFEPRTFDVPSPDPRGIVVAQQPAGREQAPPDSRVRINVSTGEQSGQPSARTGTVAQPGSGVSVPEVVGLSQTAALRRLHAVSLRGVVQYRGSSEPRGRVIDQFPRPGSSKNAEARVRLVVSAGQETAERVAVPDVRGEDEETATAMLEDAGFRVEVIRTGGGATVEDQQPAPGVRSYADAVVTLFVG